MWGSSPECSWPSSSSECSFSSSSPLLLVGVALLVESPSSRVAVELEQLDVIGELEHRRARRLDLLDDVDHPLFESGTVDDEQVGVLHRLGLLRRGGEIMGIGADRHDHLDLGQVTDGLGHDVAQDVRGDHDLRQLTVGRRRRRTPSVPAARWYVGTVVSDAVSSEPQATARTPSEQTAATRIGVRIFLIQLS